MCIICESDFQGQFEVNACGNDKLHHIEGPTRVMIVNWHLNVGKYEVVMVSKSCLSATRCRSSRIDWSFLTPAVAVV